MTTTQEETSRRFALSDKRAVYLYSRKALQENIANMRTAFEKLYGNFAIGYSFKTNYLRDICLTAKKNGCMAEVVSPEEYTYARELGFPERHIIFNGVILNDAFKALAAWHGSIVNVDNLNELKGIEAFAKESEIKLKVGIRCNFDVGVDVVSRYGIDITGDDFQSAMELVANSDNVKLGGFHCHIGFTRPKHFWADKIEAMIDLARKYKACYIDLGGGMYGPVAAGLESQFNGYVPNFSEYAEIVASKMKIAFPDEDVMLIVEPGTALVGNVMDVKATVTEIKTVRGKQFVTMNCNSNQLGMICEYKVLPYEITHNHINQEIDIVDGIIGGNTCLEKDYISEHFTDCVAVGDDIVFKNVGAYSLCMGRQFIVPRLGVVEKDTGEIMRMPESYKDMFYQYFNAATL